MEFGLVWIALCVVAALIANNKGRSAAGFFALALFLSPLVGIIAALVVKPNSQNVENKKVESGEAKKCPKCAELVKPDAIKCRWCGNDFDLKDKQPVEASSKNKANKELTHCPKCSEEIKPKGAAKCRWCGHCFNKKAA